MLNEIYEYEQYTSSLEDFEKYTEKYGNRLRYAELVPDLSGISRAMSIIARGVLAGRWDAAAREDARKALEAFSVNQDEETSCWLCQYLEGISSDWPEDDAKKKKVNKLLGSYNLKSKDWSKDSFDLTANEKNDLNRISFDRIIADAINEGPLKRLYLVTDLSEEEVFEGLVHRANGKATALNGRAKGPKKNREEVLMLIAHFLLNRFKETGEGASYAGLMRMTDFSNWRQKKAERERFIQNFMSASSEDRVIDINPLVTGVLLQIEVNEEWFKKCNFRLAEREELDALLEEKPDLLFYRDYYFDEMTEGDQPHLIAGSFYREEE